jgi:hypothetical protein
MPETFPEDEADSANDAGGPGPTDDNQARLDVLEQKLDLLLRRLDSNNDESLGENTSTRLNGATASARGSTATAQTDIQDEFRAIKDAVQRVRLPQDLKIDDSKQGIKRGEQAKCNIISKCASYTETVLKILLTLQPDEPLPEQTLKDLFVVSEAQIRYLQEERALVLVNSSLGDSVGGIYRHFRKNTSAFPPDALEALTAAVSLSAASQQQSRQYQQRGRGYSNSRHRFFRGSGSWRGSRIPSTRDSLQHFGNSSTATQDSQ